MGSFCMKHVCGQPGLLNLTFAILWLGHRGRGELVLLGLERSGNDSLVSRQRLLTAEGS